MPDTQRKPAQLKCEKTDTLLFFFKLVPSASKICLVYNPVLPLHGSSAEQKGIFSRQLIYQNTKTEEQEILIDYMQCMLRFEKS